MKSSRRTRKRIHHTFHRMRRKPVFWVVLLVLITFSAIGGILIYNYVQSRIYAIGGFKSVYTRGGIKGVAKDRILVKFKSSASATQKTKIYGKYGIKKKSNVGKTSVESVSIPTGADPEKLADQIGKNDPGTVEFAEADILMAPVIIPNDPYYQSWQWHLPIIKTPEAWDIVKATDVVVAVCDSGFDGTHPDLINVYVPELGYNTASNNTDWSPAMFHGTAVAGAIAEEANNGIGGAGVSWGARIIPVRITNDPNGWAYFSDMTECITYSADNGAKAINLSYGGIESSTINEAALYAKNKGSLLVMAAGNSGIQHAFPDYPAFIGVSATDQIDQKASFSSYGTYVDIAAPGVNILTTDWPGGGYARYNGTSLATPIVTGVVALLHAAKPSITPDEVMSVLYSTADDLGPAGEDIYFGSGRVNALKAVQKITGDTPVPTVLPHPTSTASPTPSPSPSPRPTLAPTPTPDPGFTDCLPGGNWGSQKYYDSANSYLFVRGSHHGEFNEPQDLLIASDGKIYVADALNWRIQILDSGMNYLAEWNLPSENVQYERRPSGIAQHPNGQFWVVDNWNSRIIIYDASGSVVKIFGTKGSGPGQFNMPDSIAIDSQGNAYVSDRWNYRIQKFDMQGNFLLQWGSQGGGNGQFYYPAGLNFGPDGLLYVTDTVNSRIQMFTTGGTFAGIWGSMGIVGTLKDKVGLFPGQFYFPEDIAFDSSGNIYVADSLNHRIQKFTRTRTFITMWGSWGNGNGFLNTPASVAVDASGSIYVADRGNSKISRFTCKK